MDLKAIKLAIGAAGALLLATGGAAAWVLKDWAWCPNCAYAGPSGRMDVDIALGDALKLPEGFVQESAGGKKSDPPIKSATLRDGGLVLIRQGQRRVEPKADSDSGGEGAPSQRHAFQIATWKPGNTGLVGATVLWPEPLKVNINSDINPVTGALVMVSDDCDVLVAPRQSNGSYGGDLVRISQQTNAACTEITWDPLRSDVAYIKASLVEKDERFLVVRGGQARLSPDLGQSVRTQMAAFLPQGVTPMVTITGKMRGKALVSAGWIEETKRPGSEDLQAAKSVSAEFSCVIESGECELLSKAPVIEIRFTDGVPNKMEVMGVDGSTATLQAKDELQLGYSVVLLQAGLLHQMMELFSTMPGSGDTNEFLVKPPRWLPDWIGSRLARGVPFQSIQSTNAAEIVEALTRITKWYERMSSDDFIGSASRQDANGNVLTTWDALGSSFDRNVENTSGLRPVLERSDVFGAISSDVPIGTVACLEDRAQTLRTIEVDVDDGQGGTSKSERHVIDPQMVRALSSQLAAVTGVPTSGLNRAPARWLLFPVSRDLPTTATGAVERVLSQPTVKLIQAPTPDELCDG